MVYGNIHFADCQAVLYEVLLEGIIILK